MNGLLSAIKAFVLKSRPAYKDYLGNGKYDVKKLPEECVPDSVCVNIRTAQSTADAAQSTADAARRKAQSTAENISSGKTWTQSNLTSISSYALYYADGIWVAGSLREGLYYSTDGKTWTQSNLTSIYNIIALYYADGIWVAGSIYKGLYYSTDGKTWTQSNLTSISINALYYADGIWVAGSDIFTNTGLYYSTDGKTWTQSNLTSIGINALYYADGIWVAGSNGQGLYYSTDGRTWTQSDITSTNKILTLYYADGIWVAGSYEQGLYYSQSKFAFAKTVDIQIAEINQSMNQFQRIGDDVIINSSTPDSTKKFKITVDDTGTISATEVS